MNPIALDEFAEQQLLDDVDQGCPVPSGADVVPRHLPVEAGLQIRAARRLRRTFHPVRTRLVPVVLGLVVAALALGFSLTGDTFAILLLVPSALVAWMTLHAVATSPPRGVRQGP